MHILSKMALKNTDHTFGCHSILGYLEGGLIFNFGVPINGSNVSHKLQGNMGKSHLQLMDFESIAEETFCYINDFHTI